MIIKSRRDGQSRIESQLTKLAVQGIKFKTVARCESPEVVKEFVRRGLGLGFLYHNSIKRGIERGEFKTVHVPGFDLTGRNAIVYSKEKPLSSLAREFLTFLRASVTKKAPDVAVTSQRPNKRRSGYTSDLATRPEILY